MQTTRIPVRSRQRGMVLVIVLWIVALLSIMAASFAYSMRTETQLAASAVGQAQARALAEAGVHYVLLHLLNPTASEQWPVDGAIREWRFGSGLVRISVVSADGRIDLNAAHRELLSAWLAAAGAPEESLDSLLDAIQDWRDPDDLPLLNGAESAAYSDAGWNAGPKNAPFESVEELQQVLGVTPEIYRRAAPGLTVYSRRPGIDPAVAPESVLKAIPGIDPQILDQYLAQRAHNQAEGLPPPEPPAVAGPYLSRGRRLAYHIAAEARLETGVTASVEVVATQGSRPDQPFQLLAWREGGR